MSHKAREHVWALKQIGAHIPEEMKKQVAPKRPPVVVAITPTRVNVIRRHRDGAYFIRWTALGPMFGSPTEADRFDSPDVAFELARTFPWVKTEVATGTVDEFRADANDWLAKK